MNGTSRTRIVVAFLLCAVLISGLLLGRASADQPHMQAALDHLRLAEADLRKADPDKGGHREKAMKLVNQAINQVEMGINFDRKH